MILSEILSHKLCFHYTKQTVTKPSLFLTHFFHFLKIGLSEFSPKKRKKKGRKTGNKSILPEFCHFTKELQHTMRNKL